MSQNVLVEYYRRLLNKDTDIRQSSKARKNQGNISSTAKIYLCIEILYTIGWKSFEQTGLSFKKNG